MDSGPLPTGVTATIRLVRGSDAVPVTRAGEDDPAGCAVGERVDDRAVSADPHAGDAETDLLRPQVPDTEADDAEVPLGLPDRQEVAAALVTALVDRAEELDGDTPRLRLQHRAAGGGAADGVSVHQRQYQPESRDREDEPGAHEPSVVPGSEWALRSA